MTLDVAPMSFRGPPLLTVCRLTFFLPLRNRPSSTKVGVEGERDNPHAAPSNIRRIAISDRLRFLESMSCPASPDHVAFEHHFFPCKAPRERFVLRDSSPPKTSVFPLLSGNRSSRINFLPPAEGTFSFNCCFSLFSSRDSLGGSTRDPHPLILRPNHCDFNPRPPFRRADDPFFFFLFVPMDNTLGLNLTISPLHHHLWILSFHSFCGEIHDYWCSLVHLVSSLSPSPFWPSRSQHPSLICTDSAEPCTVTWSFWEPAGLPSPKVSLLF